MQYWVCKAVFLNYGDLNGIQILLTLEQIQINELWLIFMFYLVKKKALFL